MTDDGEDGNGSSEEKDKGQGNPAPIVPPTEPIVSKKDFDSIQKQLVEAQGQLATIAKKEVDNKKISVIEKLKLINPKLAEDNAEAELSTLEIMLSTAEKMNSGFKKHQEEVIKTVEKGIGGYDPISRTWK